MQLEFNKKNKTLSIKDDVPLYAKAVLFLLGINIANLTLQLFLMDTKSNTTLFAILSIVNIVSIVLLIRYVKNKSWKSILKISEIAGVKEKTSLGRKRVYLALKNGKQRNFSALSNEEELKQLYKTLNSIGIKSI